MLTRQESIKNFVEEFTNEFGFKPVFSGEDYLEHGTYAVDFSNINIPIDVEFKSKKYFRIVKFFEGYAAAHNFIFHDEIMEDLFNRTGKKPGAIFTPLTEQK